MPCHGLIVCTSCTQVYEFARELAAIDVFLFNFITALDDKLGLQNMSTNHCGYVSL